MLDLLDLLHPDLEYMLGDHWKKTGRLTVRMSEATGLTGILTRYQGDHCVVNSGEGLTAIDFDGGDVAMAGAIGRSEGQREKRCEQRKQRMSERMAVDDPWVSAVSQRSHPRTNDDRNHRLTVKKKLAKGIRSLAGWCKGVRQKKTETCRKIVGGSRKAYQELGRFAKGIGKFARNMLGDRRKKTRRLAVRMPEAAGLTGVHRPYPGIWVLSAVDTSMTDREIVYPCILDPDEGGQASSSLAVSTRWISIAKLL
ncbi:hypothetical protein BHE74_00017474 [Ensete ventricosum]|nr:hypothetical protein BHE74_00017474 [Ensete ventricosum]